MEASDTIDSIPPRLLAAVRHDLTANSRSKRKARNNGSIEPVRMFASIWPFSHDEHLAEHRQKQPSALFKFASSMAESSGRGKRSCAWMAIRTPHFQAQYLGGAAAPPHH